MSWIVVQDGNEYARQIFLRHYSHRNCADGRRPKKIVGPGEYLMLLDRDCTALFVWRKFRSMNGQTGINCSVFRNESTALSSDLILMAETMAQQRWPEETRMYTYVNPRKIKSTNPGYCFLRAGWRRCGTTKRNKLVILEKQLGGGR